MFQNKKLKAALTDMSARNKILMQCNRAEPHQEYLAKMLLAIWLGDNAALYNIEQSTMLAEPLKTEIIACAKGIFLCLANIEHAKTCALRLGDVDKVSVLKVLERIQLRFLQRFNQQHAHFLCEPISWFEALQKAIVEANQPDDTLAVQAVFNSLQKASRDSLKQHDLKGPLLAHQPSAYSQLNSWWYRSSLTNTGTLIHSIDKRIPKVSFYQFSALFQGTLRDLHMHKIVLKNESGGLIDGLMVKTPGQPDDTVVLVMRGGQPSEHTLTHSEIKNYQALFGVPFVLVNHRSNGQLSGLAADSLMDLVSDVAIFAKQFHQQGKSVVLYGLCWAAPIMLLAAKSLKDMDIPTKLVCDRTFSHYAFADLIKLNSMLLSEAWGVHAIQNQHVASLLQSFIAGGLCVLSTPLFFRFLFSDLTLDLGAIARLLPPEDLLTLEIKPGKDQVHAGVTYDDTIISHENNLRHALSPKRAESKQGLEALSRYSRTISRSFAPHSQLRSLFEALSVSFDQLLKIIKNEKLTIAQAPPKIPKERQYMKVINLHSINPVLLIGREGIPMSEFFQGFFARPVSRWKRALDSIRNYPILAIECMLYVNHRESSLLHDSYGEFAKIIHEFLELMMKHKTCLLHLGSRATYHHLGDIEQVWDLLMKTTLFTELSARGPLFEKGCKSM